MTDLLQFGIVTGVAGVALAVLVWPLMRRRPRTAPGQPPACAKCTVAPSRRRA
jgi:hypothetical protein